MWSHAYIFYILFQTEMSNKHKYSILFRPFIPTTVREVGFNELESHQSNRIVQIIKLY